MRFSYDNLLDGQIGGDLLAVVVTPPTLYFAIEAYPTAVKTSANADLLKRPLEIVGYFTLFIPTYGISTVLQCTCEIHPDINGNRGLDWRIPPDHA